MARVRRMASAGFTTPLTRRVEDGVCVISLGAGGDAEHSWGTKCAEHPALPGGDPRARRGADGGRIER